MLLWRLDCQHAEFDGAMVTFGMSQEGLLIRAQMLRPWGWLCDVYQVEIDLPHRCLPLLLTQTWPTASTAELCQLAQREPNQTFVDHDSTFEPSEVA